MCTRRQFDCSQHSRIISITINSIDFRSLWINYPMGEYKSQQIVCQREAYKSNRRCYQSIIVDLFYGTQSNVNLFFGVQSAWRLAIAKMQNSQSITVDNRILFSWNTFSRLWLELCSCACVYVWVDVCAASFDRYYRCNNSIIQRTMLWRINYDAVILEYKRYYFGSYTKQQQQNHKMKCIFLTPKRCM